MTSSSSAPVDLIGVLEAMEEETEMQMGEENEGRENKTHNRKLPDWMRDPHEVAEETVQRALAMQAMKKAFRDTAATECGINENEKYQDTGSRWIELEYPVHKGRVICFDLETTGFGNEDSIIEVGAVELIDGYRTGSLFQSYAKPRGKIHPMAQAAHEITESMLHNAPPIQIVMASFLDWIGTSPLVAHNLSFDLRMLNQELDRLDMGHFVTHHPAFCSLRYWRKLFPQRSGTLDDLSASFGVSRIIRRFTHGALVDSEVLAQCYAKLCKL
eukprot:Phypoly_transcript_13288.p1 GENE.Phypoly_transcript_13288~~Phypoly_transcript_13288.p1  ORF type:complete len:272 (+),score=41.05 Phypoly_transcript_13288:225-1040(+)